MKAKSIIGTCAMVLVVGASVFWGLVKNEQSDAIQGVIQNIDTVPYGQKDLYDLNQDGKVNNYDLFLCKLQILLPFTKTGGSQKMYPAIEKNVKQYGRCFYNDQTETLWCSLSGTGIGFSFHGKQCTLTLVADTAFASGQSSNARYAVYVNGEETQVGQLYSSELTLNVFESEQEQDVEIRVVKLSEAVHSSMGVKNIVVDDKSGIRPLEKKDHLIEFVGDSITCGYGVDALSETATFMTANENATKTYAYHAADLLDADYSLVSYSGYGVVSGYTVNEKINANDIISKYYDKFGFCYASFDNGRQIQNEIWDYSDKPDLIVLNLGTNDSSYTGNDETRQAEFVDAYVEFLTKIREKNPNTAILCTLGMMGDTLCPSVEKAVDLYAAKTGDNFITSMRFDVQEASDGYAVDYHPSAVTQQKSGDKLAAFIKEWLGW